MIKYEYISVPVTWAYNDTSKLNEYGETGWRFVCYVYSTLGTIVAVFERRIRIENE